MYDTKVDILDGLSATPKVLARLLPVVSSRQPMQSEANLEGWAAVEIVCHLRDAEERAVERTMAMCDRNEPLIEGYDQEAWAHDRDYKSEDLIIALAGFVEFRQAHIAALEAIPFSAWERAGHHQEFGRITILGHAQHVVSHDLIHLAQLASLE